MRTFSLACLTLGLLLQVGCASVPRFTALRQQTPNPKEAEQLLVARQLECQGKHEQARELYKQMLDKHPNNPEYLHRMAVVCTRLQRYGEASSLYERARQRDPRNASLLADMGYTAYLRGDREEAERLLREAVHIKPSDKRALSNLALVVGSYGKFDECLDLLRQAGDEANAIAGLAYVHTQRGETDLAENRYREALKQDPTLKEASEALAELSKSPRRSEKSAAGKASTSDDTFSFAAVSQPATNSSEIQQIGAFEESTKSVVTTAHFVEDSKSSEPALLDERVEFAVSADLADETKPLVDDVQSQDDEVPAVLPETEAADQPAKDDDWATDQPVTSKPTRMASQQLAADFEPTIDNDTSPKQQPSSTFEPMTDSLTFRPRKSHTISAAARKTRDVDTSFSTPQTSKDQSE